MKRIRMFVFVLSTLLVSSSAFGQLVFPDRPIGGAPGGQPCKGENLS